MNKLRYLIVLFFSIVLVACEDDTANIIEQIESQPNTIGFVNRNVSRAAIADGSEYTFTFPVQVVGPTSENLTGTYTANVSVDPASTAVEGVHYRLESTQISASEETGYLAQFTVVMLTEGVETPLAQDPVLILNVSDAQGQGNVIASGAQLRLTLQFLCPSDLQGDYETTIVRDDGNTYVYTETLAKIGDGQYRGQTVGHWAPGAIGGTPGFNFTDVCGVISVPQQNLVDLYSNQVFQSGDSFVNEDGSIQIKYTVTFAAGDRTYTATYRKL